MRCARGGFVRALCVVERRTTGNARVGVVIYEVVGAASRRLGALCKLHAHWLSINPHLIQQQ